MKTERLTDRARKVMALANQEAQRFNHEIIGTEHILLGLLKEGSGVGAGALTALGIDFERVGLEVRKLLKDGSGPVVAAKLPQTPAARRVFDLAAVESRALDHNYIGTEHLLLGLLRENDGIAAQVLSAQGVTTRQVRDLILNPPTPKDGTRKSSPPDDDLEMAKGEVAMLTALIFRLTKELNEAKSAMLDEADRLDEWSKKAVTFGCVDLSEPLRLRAAELRQRAEKNRPEPQRSASPSANANA